MHDDPLSGPDDAERGAGDHDADATRSHNAPPDPLDRIWRHPAELGRVRASRPSQTSGRPSPMLITSLAIGGSVVGAVLTVGILALSGLLNGRPHPTANDRFVQKATNDATLQAVASVRPSVVLVTAKDGGTSRQGAGVVIRHGGDILTSSWLVGNLTEVTIETDDDKQLTASVVGSDTTSGLALLEADSDDLPAAMLATHGPGIGNSVVALSGDPHAIGIGMVSATDVVVSSAGVTMANVFATDARPPFDDAGAPVINGRAQVAGILLPNGLGAVPIDYARDIADSIRNSGSVEHAWIGVVGANSQYGGPEMRHVTNGGPAYLAGMQSGDVVMSVNGRTVNTADELRADVRDHWPNQTLKFVVSRGGTSLPLDVTAAAPPSQPEQPVVTRPRPKVTTTTTLPVAYIGS
ncbi:MAG TPA: S1C family serine protease [Acidimicrobiia bacterium]